MASNQQTVVFVWGGEEVGVPEGGFIGRSSHAHLRIEHPQVSEFHAGISIREEGVVILPLRGAVYIGNDAVPADGAPLEANSEVRLASGLHGARNAVPVRVLRVSPPLSHAWLEGLGPEGLSLPIDSDFAASLHADFPYLGKAERPPILLRSEGSYWITGPASRHNPTGRVELRADRTTPVILPGGKERLLRLRVRLRDGRPRTTAAIEVEVVVLRDRHGEESVAVYDLTRPGSSPRHVRNLPGRFLAAVVRASERGAKVVVLDEVARPLWEENTRRRGVSGVHEVRKALGHLGALLVTVESEQGPPGLRLDLPGRSTVILPDDGE